MWSCIVLCMVLVYDDHPGNGEVVLGGRNPLLLKVGSKLEIDGKA